MKIPTWLKNLLVKEVSLVDRPANQEANVVLVKGIAKPCAGCTSPESCMQKRACTDFVPELFNAETTKQLLNELSEKYAGAVDLSAHLAADQLYSYTSAFTTACRQVIERANSRDEIIAGIAEALSQFNIAVATAFTTEKQSAPDAGDTTGDRPTPEENLNMTKEEREKKAAELRKQAAELESGSTEEVLKGLTPEARAIVEKSQAEAAAAKKQADETAIALQKMQDEARDKELLAKATSAVGKVGIKAEEIVKTLKQLDETGQALVLDLLAKANSFAKTASAFEERGIGDGHVTGAAGTKLEKRVAEIQKDNTKLTKEQATAQALDEDPDLYDEMDPSQGSDEITE